MRKCMYFTVFFIGFLMIGCAVKKSTTDWNDYNLKGKIKSFKETTYKTVENINEEKRRELYSQYKLFNKQGKIKKSFYESNGRTSKIRFKYNNKGKLIEKNFFKPDGSPRNKMTYGYDAKGNKIEEKWYAWRNSNFIFGSKYVYKYDDKGNKIKQDVYSSTDSLVATNTYKYNEKDKMIKQKRLNFMGYHHNLDKNYVYAYDKEGNEIEKKQYNYDGSLNKTYRYKYNSMGDIVQKKQMEPGKTSSTMNTFKYNYDENGNWIKMSCPEIG